MSPNAVVPAASNARLRAPAAVAVAEVATVAAAADVPLASRLMPCVHSAARILPFRSSREKVARSSVGIASRHNAAADTDRGTDRCVEFLSI